MNKQTIAVDIDDVLSTHATDFVAYSNRRWGTNLNVDDYDEHWAKMWNINNEETEQRAVEFHKAGVVGNYGYREEAIVALRELAQTYKLVFATSRRRELEKETLVWINKYFGSLFAEVHFAGLWDKVTYTSHTATKAELCRQIGADYLIDDQLKHCLAAAEAGIPALLFGDYKWNQTEKALPREVVRIANWQEVLEYFDNKTSQNVRGRTSHK